MSWEMYTDGPSEPIDLMEEVTEYVLVKKKDYQDMLQIIEASRTLCDAIINRFGGWL